MRVVPFPAFVPNGPERMLADTMKSVKGNNNPDALEPALSTILQEYPDFGDGYWMAFARWENDFLLPARGFGKRSVCIGYAAGDTTVGSRPAKGGRNVL